MNFHYYPAYRWRWDRYGPGIIGKTAAVALKLAEYGLEKPTIVTEAGYWSDAKAPFFPASSLEEQARYVPQLFARPDALSGVVGIVAVGGEFVRSDVIRAVHFTILLSVNLAVFNLLPIPVLDGGKIVLYLLEKLHRKAVRLYVPLTVIGVLLIVALILYATALDIGRIVT